MSLTTAIGAQLKNKGMSIVKIFEIKRNVHTLLSNENFFNANYYYYVGRIIN